MNLSVFLFSASNIAEYDVEGKSVLEVGSHNVNGSVRPLVLSYRTNKYVGVDVVKGPGVDLICPAEDLVSFFGKESFDLVISTEVLEHAWDWRNVILNMKHVLKPGRVLILTTRSIGFPYHPPYDFWRYEIDDMELIFRDFVIEKLDKDPMAPGVLLKARKPKTYVAQDLKEIAPYSMLTGKREKHLSQDLVCERLCQEGSRTEIKIGYRIYNIIVTALKSLSFLMASSTKSKDLSEILAFLGRSAWSDPIPIIFEVVFGFRELASKSCRVLSRGDRIIVSCGDHIIFSVEKIHLDCYVQSLKESARYRRSGSL